MVKFGGTHVSPIKYLSDRKAIDIQKLSVVKNASKTQGISNNLAIIIK